MVQEPGRQGNRLSGVEGLIEALFEPVDRKRRQELSTLLASLGATEGTCVVHEPNQTVSRKVAPDASELHDR